MRQDALALVRDPFPPLWPCTHWVKLHPASDGTLTCGDPSRSRRFGCSYGLSTGRTGQNGVELSRDVALQTADDLGLGLALFGAPLHVGAGGWMPGHPADRDQVQRR